VADDVGDEDLPPVEPDAGEELVQKLAGGADEGLALKILVIAGGLAEEEDARVTASVAGDRLARAPMERARGAGADLVGDEPEIDRGVVQRCDYAAGEGLRGALRAR